MIEKEERLPFYNDDIFKFLINLLTEGSYTFVYDLIYAITGILPTSIEKFDRVFDRQNPNMKSSEVDGLFVLNDEFIIDIEVQRTLSFEALSHKIHRYLGYMLTSTTLKGQKDNEKVLRVMMIVFYLGSIDDSQDLVATGKYRGDKKSTKMISNMNTYVVQLGKVNDIFEKKGIKKMSSLERVSFVIQNAHKEKYSDIIKILKKLENEVAYMEKRYDEFTMDIGAYLMAKRKEVNEFAIKETIRDTKRDFEELGLKKGKMKEKEETAMRMLASGKYTIEAIVEITGLNIEDVKRLSTL